MRSNSVFVWTEAFGCAQILKPILSSFRAHHDEPIHVFTTRGEAKSLPDIQGVIPVFAREGISDLILKTNERSISAGFRKGHLGTARIWSSIFRSRREEYLVHLDADTIFLDNLLDKLISPLRQGYDISGTRRPYKNRTYRKTGRDSMRLDALPDVINTDLLALRRSKIPNVWSPFLARNIRGKRMMRHPIIDFFDPIIFSMLRNGSQIKFVDSPLDGMQAIPNVDSEFFRNRIVFSAVGSGYHFYHNANARTSPSYKEFAIASYSLFAKYLLDIDTGTVPHIDKELEAKLKKLDRGSWTLK